jgi:HEAT repeat protein
LLEPLNSNDPDDRVMAIQILGEVGDQRALSKLRERLAIVNKELLALVVAIGKLKKRLGVK